MGKTEVVGRGVGGKKEYVVRGIDGVNLPVMYGR